MKTVFYDAEVIKIINETPVTKRFILKFNNLSSFDFKAGQFVMLELPIADKVKTRSYSIASAPNGNLIELVIVLNPAGMGTSYIWEHVKTGSVIKCSGALGKFLLPVVIDRDLALICTGTGIAPFRSMLWHIFDNQVPHYQIYLIFGCRKKEDLLYHDELLNLESTQNSFHYLPVLSRETSLDWNGETGYVHGVYQKIFSDRRPAYFYLCGWTEMLKEARMHLKSMDYDNAAVRFELYT